MQAGAKDRCESDIAVNHYNTSSIAYLPDRARRENLACRRIEIHLSDLNQPQSPREC